MNSKPSRSIQNALIVVLMAALWALFAPLQFGGSASYVIVAGASMEPTLQQGDLVIARQASTYEVGDIATYQHPKVGPVIHRIIDREGPNYRLQGDNNEWIDSYEPASTEILGKSWLHIPGAAEKLLWLRSPTGLSLLSLSIGLMFLITIANKNEGHNKEQPQEPDVLTKWFRRTQSLRLGEWVFPLAIVLFASAILGTLAFTRPETQTIPVDIPYIHSGAFKYQAVGSPSVYEQGRVQSGEAIFHALVQYLDLNFSYALETESPADLSGAYSMVMRISEPSGWQRTIELQPETIFKGSAFETNTAIKLTEITRTVQLVKTRTGLSRQVFNVDILVPVHVEGRIAGIDFNETFTAFLPFKLDDLELYVDQQDPLTENANPLMPQRSSYLTDEHSIPNTLNIFGLSLDVSQVRQIAIIAGSISLILIGLIIAPAIAISARSETERIKLQYTERILDVSEIPTDRRIKWIQVAEIEDLIKLAETSGALILHARQGDEHTYVLKDDGTAYRLTINDPDGTDLDANSGNEESHRGDN